MLKILIALIISQGAFANEYSINPLATEQTKQFATLLGKWEITDSSIDKQGKWQLGVGADWNWYTILDGHAIQDEWIQPSLSKDIDNNKRQYGTNIRIYNPQKNQWEMAWASNGGKKIDTFTAKGKDGTIIMTGIYSGENTRITFYNMKADTFDWKMEYQSKTDKNLWKEVYRIHGKRKKK